MNTRRDNIIVGTHCMRSQGCADSISFILLHYSVFIHVIFSVRPYKDFY